MNKNQRFTAITITVLIAVIYLAYTFFNQVPRKIIPVKSKRSSLNRSEESAFNPDIIQSPQMILIKNRNQVNYVGCELTINDRFVAKVPKVKPGDVFIIHYMQLIDKDGNLYSPQSMQINEAEFYCKDYNGHDDIMSLER